MDLVYVANVPVGKEIQTRMLDVVARVKSIRPYAVGMCRKLIGDIAFVGNLQDPSNCPEVVFAAAWICGEYARCVRSYVSQESALLNFDYVIQ